MMSAFCSSLKTTEKPDLYEQFPNMDGAICTLGRRINKELKKRIIFYIFKFLTYVYIYI